MNPEVNYVYTLLATLGTLLSVGALVAGSAWLWALRSWREAAPLVAATVLYLLLFFGSPPPAIQAAFRFQHYSLWDAARLVAYGVAWMLLVHAGYKAWCEGSEIKAENARLKAQLEMCGQPQPLEHSGGSFGGSCG